MKAKVTTKEIEMAKFGIMSIDHQRNGVSGCPFGVAIVKYDDKRFLVVTFDDEPEQVRTAAFEIDLLVEGEISPCRGDFFHDFIMDELEKAELLRGGK